MRRIAFVIALLVLPTAQAAWEDVVWWGHAGDGLVMDRNHTVESDAPTYSAATYVQSADPTATQGPQGVSWTFDIERGNETLDLVWGAPLTVWAAFSTHTTRLSNEDPGVDEEVPGAGVVSLSAVLRLAGQDIAKTPVTELDADGWTEVSWSVPNPLSSIPSDADLQLVIWATGPASQYRLGLSEATGWTRLALPVYVPPPPVVYNETAIVSQAWQLAWSETMQSANRSHVATWASPGAAVLEVDVEASNGTAWIAVRDASGHELFNGTSTPSRILTAEPGNWTIEARAIGFAGTLAWTIRDIEGEPMAVGAPVNQSAPPTSPAPPAATSEPPVTEWKPAQPIDNQEAPVPWWVLLAVLALARTRRS